jgi:sensor histidine kinase regulating citrate/malate metabolism
LAAYIAAHAHSEIHALRPNDTAANMITKILTGFPLTPSQRNLIRVDIRQDFALRSYPHNVGLAISCLLSNALKAIESVTNPEITILIEVDGTQRISIADTGAGIPQAIVEQLKKDPQTVPRTEQHGWGLLLCNRLMRSFSGTLSFQHMEERKGTKAILTFPNSELMES